MVIPKNQQLWDMISLCGYHQLNMKLNLNLNLFENLSQFVPSGCIQSEILVLSQIVMTYLPV